MPASVTPSAVRTVAELVSSHLQVAGDDLVSHVAQVWERHPEEDGMAVVEQARVRYLSRARFFHQLGKKFGYSLYENRPVSLLAEEGSTVEADMNPVEVISLASQREPERVFDHILVLEGGHFLGLVSMRDLLVHHRTLLVAGVAERALLEEQNRLLGARTRLQDELVGNLTRELRAPVNTMAALAQALATEPELPLRHRSALEEIRARAGDVLAFVNDLTDLARLDREGIEPSAERATVQELLEEAVAEARVQLGARAPDVSIGASPGSVLVDAEFVRRIASSLLAAAGLLAREVALSSRTDDQQLDLRFELAGAEAEAVRRVLTGGTGPTRSSGPELRVAVARGLAERLGGTLQPLAEPAVGFGVRIPAPPA